MCRCVQVQEAAGDKWRAASFTCGSGANPGHLLPLQSPCYGCHADHGWKYEIIPYLVSTSLHLAAPRPAAAIFKTSKWVD